MGKNAKVFNCFYLLAFNRQQQTEKKSQPRIWMEKNSNGLVKRLHFGLTKASYEKKWKKRLDSGFYRLLASLQFVKSDLKSILVATAETQFGSKQKKNYRVWIGISNLNWILKPKNKHNIYENEWNCLSSIAILRVCDVVKRLHVNRMLCMHSAFWTPPKMLVFFVLPVERFQWVGLSARFCSFPSERIVLSPSVVSVRRMCVIENSRNKRNGYSRFRAVRLHVTQSMLPVFVRNQRTVAASVHVSMDKCTHIAAEANTFVHKRIMRNEISINFDLRISRWNKEKKHFDFSIIYRLFAHSKVPCHCWQYIIWLCVEYKD